MPERQPVVLGYRNPTVPLAATTRFDHAKFAGKWQAIACIGACADHEAYSTYPEGIYQRTTAGGGWSYLVSPPGVLREMGGRHTLVVMWVDEGFRTAAIGDANGRWAAIIDRKRPGGDDRVKAATEILDFNGWDISKLRKINE